MQTQGQLLAGDLGCDIAHRQIGDLVFGVEPRAFRHLSGQPLAQRVDAVAALGGDHKSFGEVKPRVHLLGQAQQHGCFDPVDLVDRQRHAAAFGDVAKFLKNTLDTLGHAAVRLDQQHDHIGIRSPAPSGGNHRAVQTAARLEQTGRVDKNKLRLPLHRNTADAGAGGLHLMRHD